MGLIRVEEQQGPIATKMVHGRQDQTKRDSLLPVHKLICQLESQGAISKTRSPFNSSRQRRGTASPRSLPTPRVGLPAGQFQAAPPRGPGSSAARGYRALSAELSRELGSARLRLPPLSSRADT